MNSKDKKNLEIKINKKVIKLLETRLRVKSYKNIEKEQCECCKLDIKSLLEIHHIIPVKKVYLIDDDFEIIGIDENITSHFNVIEKMNLMTLCRNCHDLLHDYKSKRISNINSSEQSVLRYFIFFEKELLLHIFLLKYLNIAKFYRSKGYDTKKLLITNFLYTYEYIRERLDLFIDIYFDKLLYFENVKIRHLNHDNKDLLDDFCKTGGSLQNIFLLFWKYIYGLDSYIENPEIIIELTDRYLKIDENEYILSLINENACNAVLAYFQDESLELNGLDSAFDIFDSNKINNYNSLLDAFNCLLNK